MKSIAQLAVIRFSCLIYHLQRLEDFKKGQTMIGSLNWMHRSRKYSNRCVRKDRPFALSNENSGKNSGVMLSTMMQPHL